jgi:hypothetical protein
LQVRAWAWSSALAVSLAGLLGPAPASAAALHLPEAVLHIELRWVDPAAAQDADGGYTVSTRSLSARSPALALDVLNGEWGDLQLTRSVSVQWLQAAARGAASGSGAVVNGLKKFESGQSLAVRASWPGGVRPARVELRLGDAALEPETQAALESPTPLPSQRRLQASTTLLVPLARWVTFAAVGGQAGEAGSGSSGGSDGAPGSVRTLSTQPADGGRQLMQLRVSLP